MAHCLCQKVGNTDNLEAGFSIGASLCGGVKGEFEQLIQSFIRADFLESLQNDPTLGLAIGGSKRPAKYDGVELKTEKKAEEWNDGKSVDPDSVGQLEYYGGKEATALKAATARNEQVRSNFKGKGIGAGALGL